MKTYLFFRRKVTNFWVLVLPKNSNKLVQMSAKALNNINKLWLIDNH